jgi:23S rRNA (uracil1939-C5)-methyltransferase
MTTVELTIDTIAAGGDGIGRADGIAVFVPRTAPGDRVRVSVETRKRFARGALVDVIVASTERVEPPCEHYRRDRCGGCQLQHLGYDAQLEAKRTIVRDAITRIGKREVERPEIERSEREWRYRRKLTLAMRRTRAGAWIIGLHPFDDASRVFQLADCPITEERVVGAWRDVMAASAHFPPADELRASVRLVDDGVAIVMEGGNEWPARAAFFRAVPSAVSLWWKQTHRARTLVAQRGEPGADASFVQVNTTVGERLHAYVLDRARAHKPRVVIDAYAGAGATAIPLARDGAAVLAIEADREAVDYCAAHLPEGSRAMAARVEDALPRALPADVVLVNPPRAGIHEQVSSALQTIADAPRAVIYVSCDPATLARDLSRMPRYRVASLRSFDMFPQTAHVETVCELVPEAA